MLGYFGKRQWDSYQVFFQREETIGHHSETMYPFFEGNAHSRRLEWNERGEKWEWLTNQPFRNENECRSNQGWFTEVTNGQLVFLKKDAFNRTHVKVSASEGQGDPCLVSKYRESRKVWVRILSTHVEVGSAVLVMAALGQQRGQDCPSPADLLLSQSD